MPHFFLLEGDVIEPLIELGMLKSMRSITWPAQHHQRRIRVDPVKTVRTNVQGAINVLELARESDAVVLQASTSEIYGDPDQHPQQGKLLGERKPHWPKSLLRRGQTVCRDAVF